MHTLAQLPFESRYTQLPKRLYQRLRPTPLTSPILVALSADAARLIDLDLCQLQPEQLAAHFGAGEPLPGGDPVAMKYAGHQFGVWNPQLGDGRGLLLGQVRNDRGELWDLHLKGSGRTAYSRFGDGRAVLRSCLREFLGSEALFHLGIPTTRALCVVMGQGQVRREMPEPEATLVRITRSHVRFGHFEHLHYSGDRAGYEALMQQVIEDHWPDLLAIPDQTERWAHWYEDVLKRTAELVAKWQAYGFCHGVLNTDNMSILGETLDYGPFAFLDEYRPDAVFNHSDDQGRYAFDRQPKIVHWNLTALAETLTPYLSVPTLEDILARYSGYFQQAYRQQLSARLGLAVEQWPLVERFLQLCREQRVDWTLFLRDLAENKDEKWLLDQVLDQDLFLHWLRQWREAVDERFDSIEQRVEALCAVNPWVLPRTHVLQMAIEAAEQGDFTEVARQLRSYRQPYQRLPGHEDHAAPPPAGNFAHLSCSS